MIKGRFARAKAQKVKRLLDEPVGDLGVLAQAFRQGLLARTERGDSRRMSRRAARRDLRQAPSTRWAASFIRLNLKDGPGFGNLRADACVGMGKIGLEMRRGIEVSLMAGVLPKSEI